MGESKTRAEIAPQQSDSIHDDIQEKDANYKSGSDDLFNETPDPETQAGVKQADATTIVWTRASLILAYAFIFLNYFINSLQQQTTGNLTPYVSSDFQAHSLIPAIGIAAYILSGVLKLPIAKLIDTWGRPQGFAVMTALATLGLVLMAVCKDVETYAAAQVFYSVGFSGFSYVLDVVVADTSSLKNRALAFAFASSPYIATTFAGPSAAESFLEHSTWQWAFGCFAILTPVVAAPVFIILWTNAQKAKKLGVLTKTASGRSPLQSVWHYLIEFDAAGVILLAGGLTLFLLPFSLAGSENDGWKSGSTIAEIVIGFLLIIVFAFYEKLLAPKPFLPFDLLLDRNVFGACLLSGTLFIAYYCWDGYYTSYLQVVHQLSVADAGYVANIYNIGSCFWAIVVGYLIRVTDRFRWLAWVAVPLQILGGGLMIYFRQPNTDVGYVIMCQIFIAFGGGTLVVTEQMAVMAVAKHGQVASLLALLSLASSVGAGIGSAVSGAIWQNTVLSGLLELLPADAQDMAMDIYVDLDTQLSYPVGDPVRTAIMEAYGRAQQRMCIAGTAVLAVAIVAVVIWKDVRVSQFKQVKGRVW